MLVGRDAELRLLGELIAPDRPVVLVGPPGIGKTTLARAALGAIGPFREAGALATLSWTPLLVFRRLLGGQVPDSPEQAAGAVLRAGAEPVLIDDLQWVDDASLDVLAHLVGRVPIVATARAGEARGDDVVDSLRFLGAEVVEVPALGASDADRLARRLNPTLSDDERRSVVHAAQGNPLLIEELPKGGEGSPSLVGALVARVASLSDGGRLAVERLAVIRRPVAVGLLGAAGTGEVVDAGLASVASDEVEIRHALLGEVIAEGLGTRADEVRRGLVPLVDPVEGAHLLFEAGDLAAARASALATAPTVDRVRRAALLALAVRCAPGSGVGLDADLDLRIEAARALTATGRPVAARALCAVEGRDDLDPPARGALRIVEAEAAWFDRELGDCLALVEAGLADVRGSRTAFEVLALAGSTIDYAEVGIEGRSALDRAQEAVALATELDVELGFARGRLAGVLLSRGEPGWAELLETTIADAERAGDEDLRDLTTLGLVFARWVSGDRAEAERLARAHGEAVGPGRASQPAALNLAANAALLGLLGGRPRDELVERYAPLLEREPVFRGRSHLEAALVLSWADLGDHRRAAELADGAIERAGVDPALRSTAAWAVIESHWSAGRSEAALIAVEPLLELGAGSYPSVVLGLLIGAHAAWDLDAPVRGERPTPPFPAWRAAPIEWDAVAVARRGDHDEAVEGFLDAADAWVGSDVRGEARCRWAAADQAVASGRAGVDELVEVARRAALAAGCSPTSSPSPRGRGRRGPSVEGRSGLSAREVEALELVAEGLRTADIARAMAVSPSTVESFIRQAKRKLGVRTRVAAVARLKADDRATRAG